MTALRRKIRTMLVVFFAEMVEYRMELFFWMVATALPLIMMGLWVKAAASSDKFTMTPSEFARYYLALFLVRQMTIVWVIYHFEWHVITGRLSPLLLQPLNPLWRFFWLHISEQGARIPMVILTMLLMALAWPEAMWVPSVRAIVAALVAIVAAFALRFAIQYAFALASFWVERATALEKLFFVPYIYFSGVIAPLEEIPQAIRQIVLWTPFPYLMWYPARLLMGGQVEVSLWQVVGVMGAWMGLFVLLDCWLWWRGLRNYSAMGA